MNARPRQTPTEAFSTGRPQLTIVTPAYREAENLPVLYRRLREVLDRAEIGWEWVVVDDHSEDSTFAVGELLARQDPRVRIFRLARNSGSHAGIVCGLDRARGEGAVVMAADLQDPPEVIPALIEQWRSGCQIVWAVRASREGEERVTLMVSRLYYWLMRNLAGCRTIPPAGADFFLLDRQTIEALRRCDERNVSIFALLAWLGFRQGFVEYAKQARQNGRSGWTLAKKVKLLIDSLTSFSYLPIRAMSSLGFVVASAGLLYAVAIIVNALLGVPVQGWSSLMVAVLVLGGGQMLMLGILGEYLWRALDEARRRPRYLIEAASDGGERSPDLPAATLDRIVAAAFDHASVPAKRQRAASRAFARRAAKP